MNNLCHICKIPAIRFQNKSQFICSEHYQINYYGSKDPFEFMIYNGYFFDIDSKYIKSIVYKLNFPTTIDDFLVKNHQCVLNADYILKLDALIGLTNEQIANKINILRNFL